MKFQEIIVFVAVIICVSGKNASDSVTFEITNANTAYKTITLNRTNFDVVNKDHDTIFLIHGWIEDRSVEYYRRFIEKFIKKGNFNTITVDWSELSYDPYFTGSSDSVDEVGYVVADLIHELGVLPEKVHVVGHSLGAQVSGYAGKRLQQNHGKTLAKITGLDPAGPGFNTDDESKRLSSKDAEFVVALYTNSGIFGTTEVVGHVNYYANGGTLQKSCVIDHDNMTKFYICSHQRSVSYFIESIDTENFVAFLCTTGLIQCKCDYSKSLLFGKETPEAEHGYYYFNTNEKPPYGLGNIETCCRKLVHQDLFCWW